ncbi:MAG: hypothetical protein HGA19_20160 [Oscillochloris sp.]|nr:hypothetical protein [Oscillochloris sp.]
MIQNQTTAFLLMGDRATAQVFLSSLHGLWGGYEVLVSASGTILVRLVDQAQHSLQFDLGPDVETANLVFTTLINNDVVALARSSEPPQALLPDTAITKITLINGAGQEMSLSFDEHNELTPGLTVIRDALLALRQRTRTR